ncbi:helix-turn-helix transcriptional regulator [Microbulbifer sp.]|uniref:helix-turn-helix domain-containing protein n=1 Tax=Microbulbifer sp. TaxID=1908541 RepID=UPI00258681FA|nr:helix-turn-helix transcriptional regulator [Microbulbifer sp.]
MSETTQRVSDLKEEEQQQSKNKPCSPELLEVLAANIRGYRLALGLTQEALAEKAGVHRTYASMQERRPKNCTLGVVEAFANALEVDVVTLLTKRDWKKVKTKKPPSSRRIKGQPRNPGS